MTNLNYVETSSGVTVMFNADQLINRMGAFALRVTQNGDIEAFLVTEEGGGWVSIEEFDWTVFPTRYAPEFEKH
jgi:hypothetical protein